MADYLPLYLPGQELTSTTSAAVTGGELLVVTGPGTVARSAAANAAWLGVAAHDAANGARVTVHTGGVQRLTATGGINAGDIVVAAANGTVATNAAPGAGQQVGVALTTVANGAVVEVKMAR